MVKSDDDDDEDDGDDELFSRPLAKAVAGVDHTPAVASQEA